MGVEVLPLIQRVQRYVSEEAKRPTREANHLPPSNAEVYLHSHSSIHDADMDNFRAIRRIFINACRHFPGLRFGLMQVKMGLAILISRFQFDLCEKSDVPLVMDPKKFVMNTIGGLWLKMTRRTL
jgi:hypothetical protein